MAKNFRRSASILGAGALLLTAVGCSAEATSEEQVGTETQAYGMCFAICDQIWWEYSMSCETPGLPGTGANVWCYWQADQNRNDCDMACLAAVPEQPEPVPANPGVPPTCPRPDGPPAPVTPQVPGCDQTYQSWCHDYCSLCTFPEVTGQCHASCDDRYCPTPRPCREEMLGSCTAQCDWAVDLNSCVEYCLNGNCPPE